MIEITVDTRRAVVTNRELLTTGSTGIVVQYTLSEDWDGLVKVACFRNAEIEESQIDIAMGDSTQCSLPAENCDEQYVGEAVFAGIYGTDGNGNIVIPTIWVSLGGLRQGVKPGYASGPNPTPDMWAQIQAIAMNAGAENAAAAAQSATEADTSAESAAGSAISAGASADAAALSASAAAGSATSAGGYATAASGSATSAAQSATSAGNAQTAAEAAQGLAEEAKEAAEAAQEFLENASATATTLPPSSSATASYSDGVFTFGIPKGDKGDPGDPATNLVSSVNGKTGAVVLNATDVGAYAKPYGGIPKTDLASSVQTSLGKADTALQSAPVTSVNSKTGAVVLSASDVGAKPASYEAPVSSVNEKTGAVVLDAGDIGYESTTVEDELGTINSALSSLASVTEIIDTASGAIASFPDGAGLPVRSLVAQINPVQDLHGQDAPWPAGGGVNKLEKIAPITQTVYGCVFTPLSDGSVQVSGTPTATATTVSFTFSLPAGTYIVSCNASAGDSATGVQINRNAVCRSGQNVTLEHSGGEVDVRCRVSSGVTVNEIWKCQIESGSTATAWTPYSNICPISGWTGCEVYDTGHNAWDEVWENGYIDANGNNAPSSAIIRSKNYIPVKGGQSYCFHITDTATMWMSITQYDADKNFISQINSFTNYVMTLDANTKYVRFYASAAYGTTYNHDISINYPSTDTSYHAYQGEAISVSWQSEAGTVYGGTATYNGDGTWTLVVDHAIVDLGTLTWNAVATSTAGKYRQYSTNLVGYVKAVARNNELASITCETYPAKTADQTYGRTFGISINTSANVIVYDEMYSGENDSAAFTASVSGVKLAYPVVNPQTYTITTGELIETLVGQNNVWVDTGDVEVTYQASIKGYIDKVLAS